MENDGSIAGMNRRGVQVCVYHISASNSLVF
jgi:hypothetical protein